MVPELLTGIDALSGGVLSEEEEIRQSNHHIGNHEKENCHGSRDIWTGLSALSTRETDVISIFKSREVLHLSGILSSQSPSLLH